MLSSLSIRIILHGRELLYYDVNNDPSSCLVTPVEQPMKKNISIYPNPAGKKIAIPAHRSSCVVDIDGSVRSYRDQGKKNAGPDETLYIESNNPSGNGESDHQMDQPRQAFFFIICPSDSHAFLYLAQRDPPVIRANTRTQPNLTHHFLSNVNAS